MNRALSLALSLCAAAGALALTTEASAQTWADSRGSSWRQRDTSRKSSLWDFTFELRFGGYYPEIDEEFGGVGPYRDYFGAGAKFYFGAEVDWMPLRIPYVGRIGPAFGWGMTTMNAPAPFADQTNADTTTTDTTANGPTTSLTIHAMHASAVLRIDEISRRTIIPIVPYAKLGFGFGLWNSGTATGTSKVGSDCDATVPTDCTVAEGLSVGPHVALGGMLGLNWLDKRSGAMARANSGIDQAYLFGEWMWTNLDSGLGKPAMHIGTSSWVVGLALDL